MTRRWHEQDAAIASDGIGGREWSDRLTVEIDELRLEPDRPALRQAAGEHSLEAAGRLEIDARREDAVMREMVEAAGMVVVAMGEDHGLDVAGGIEAERREPGADLL